MFAAQAGAKRVYAVEACSTLCHLAEKLIICNRLQDRIKVINKRIEDIDRFDESIDLIISEWMGKMRTNDSIRTPNDPFRFASLPRKYARISDIRS